MVSILLHVKTNKTKTSASCCFMILVGSEWLLFYSSQLHTDQLMLFWKEYSQHSHVFKRNWNESEGIFTLTFIAFCNLVHTGYKFTQKTPFSFFKKIRRQICCLILTMMFFASLQATTIHKNFSKELFSLSPSFLSNRACVWWNQR